MATRAQAQEQREALVALLGERAVAIDEPPDAGALWRWRDGANPVVTAVRGMKVSEDVVLGSSSCRRAWSALSRSRRATG